MVSYRLQETEKEVRASLAQAGGSVGPGLASDPTRAAREAPPLACSGSLNFEDSGRETFSIKPNSNLLLPPYHALKICHFSSWPGCLRLAWLPLDIPD